MKKLAGDIERKKKGDIEKDPVNRVKGEPEVDRESAQALRRYVGDNDGWKYDGEDAEA